MKHLLDDLEAKYDWLKATPGIKTASVKLDILDLLYVLSCIRFYEAELYVRQAEMAQQPAGRRLEVVPDTRPSETEPS